MACDISKMVNIMYVKRNKITGKLFRSQSPGGQREIQGTIIIIRLRRKEGENIRGWETISIEIVFIVDLFHKPNNATVYSNIFNHNRNLYLKKSLINLLRLIIKIQLLRALTASPLFHLKIVS